MNNPIKQKSKLLLSGVIAAGTVGIAHSSSAQNLRGSNCVPYSDCQGPNDLALTGLSSDETQEIRHLATALVSLDLLKTAQAKIDVAPRDPLLYNMPEPKKVEEVRTSNLKRLEKLRKLVKVARESK